MDRCFVIGPSVGLSVALHDINSCMKFFHLHTLPTLDAQAKAGQARQGDVPPPTPRAEMFGVGSLAVFEKHFKIRAGNSKSPNRWTRKAECTLAFTGARLVNFFLLLISAIGRLMRQRGTPIAKSEAPSAIMAEPSFGIGGF